MATAAQHRRAARDGNVPDVAGASLGTAVQPPAPYQTGPDTGWWLPAGASASCCGYGFGCARAGAGEIGTGQTHVSCLLVAGDRVRCDRSPDESPMTSNAQASGATRLWQGGPQAISRSDIHPPRACSSAGTSASLTTTTGVWFPQFDHQQEQPFGQVSAKYSASSK
jgi:hypothetical protein